MKKLPSVLQEERGSSLVEYALVFLLLMTMILGMIDFSRAIYAYHFIANQARDATRYASVRGYTCGAPAQGGDNTCTGLGFYSASGVPGPSSAPDIVDFVKNVPNGIDPSKLTTTVDWPIQAASPTVCTTISSNYPGCTVRVKVSYVFNFSSTFVSKTALTLTTTSEAIITH
jgi:Flp pilus assembly protein TadG